MGDDCLASYFYEFNIGEIDMGKKVHVVLDIDGVLAGHDKPTAEETALFFLRKGAVIFLERPHYIFPGVIEFLQVLSAHPDITVSIFSAEEAERNELLMEQLLKLAMKEGSCDVIKPMQILSRSDIERLKKDGCYTKNLSKVSAAGGSLENVVLIDDDETYVSPGQEKNLLKAPWAETSHFDNLLYRKVQKKEAGVFAPAKFGGSAQSANAIFYATGLLFDAIRTANETNKPVTEVLFEKQFIQIAKADRDYAGTFVQEGGLHYQARYRELYCENKYYLLGLEALQKVNPALTLTTPQTMRASLSAPPTAEEQAKISELLMDEVNDKEGCSIM